MDDFYNKDGAESQEEIKISKKENRLLQYMKRHRIALIIIGSALVLAGAGVAAGLYLLRHDPTPVEVADKKTEEARETEATPALYEAVLTGVKTTKELAERHPLAVIVENHVDSRPQSGLNKASIVYEAIAEGGITRFMAVFGENDATKVGPIRSARTYFVDWAHGFSAFFAHVGGNIDALDKIRAENTFDLDQFRYSTAYHREYSAGLATEHTMYATTAKLWEQAAKNAYPASNNFARYKFQDEDTTETAIAARPDAQKINIAFSNTNYNVYFQYDKATNSYKRYYATGKPVVDNLTKDQISVKNLIVMTVKRKPVTTRINEAGYDMTTVGTGAAKIFVDGKVIEGTWKKTGAADREIFYDASGAEMVFNRGQFWISVVPPETGLGATVE